MLIRTVKTKQPDAELPTSQQQMETVKLHTKMVGN